jgi:hypothetical protein
MIITVVCVPRLRLSDADTLGSMHAALRDY